MSTELRPKFWENHSLETLSDAEWEALCDRCGRCCLHKLEDIDTGEHHYTDISCRLYDLKEKRCRHYTERFKHVPECLDLRTIDPKTFSWLPNTCAYRRLWEGESLPSWHPLVSGDENSVQNAKIGISDWAVNEDSLPDDADWQEHVVQWVNQ